MQRITIAKGDGIGPDIMDATLNILLEAGAQLNIDEIQVGESVYLNGNTSGITNESWKTITQNKIFLKAPITTPQGGGYKSLNVSTRKFLGLFANIRPCKSYHPYVKTNHPKLDMVIIRENEEDLYAGIEHQQTDEVIQCLKLISRPGCEKIIRYAFEYAKQYGRKKVTCFSKDNIMKQTDGLFHSVFDEIGKEYPAIEKEHWIVDIGAALIAHTPEKFDVIVTLNLYGDIISDIAAQITGSVGMGGSANIGEECAMFEAIHGSAPSIAGKNIANPSGLIHGSIMMLRHIGQNNVATKIENAWLRTLEQGIHTPDIYKESVSKLKVGTKEFAQEVIKNLGKLPQHFTSAQDPVLQQFNLVKYTRKQSQVKALVGVDIFLHWKESDPEQLAELLKNVHTHSLKLSMISNRGLKVWPEGFKESFCSDHWQCRFKAEDNVKVDYLEIISLLSQAFKKELDVIKTENLYYFDGKAGFSIGQGQ